MQGLLRRPLAAPAWRPLSVPSRYANSSWSSSLQLPLMTVVESQQRPLVGVGVLIFQAGTSCCLVGRR